VILTKGKIRDPKIKSPIAAALIGCQLGKGHDVHGQPHSQSELRRSYIYFRTSGSFQILDIQRKARWGPKSNYRLNYFADRCTGNKSKQKSEKKVVISLECIGLINLHLAAIHFSDAEMKRQLGILFTSRRASDI